MKKTKLIRAVIFLIVSGYLFIFINQTAYADDIGLPVSISSNVIVPISDNTVMDTGIIANVPQQNVYLWAGKALNPHDGTVIGPNGKETYYNLDMDGVINIMQSYGYSVNDYFVRSDGVKTLKGYAMVAADLNKFQRGSIVGTSVGLGVVCDTGQFVYNGSNTALDIATSW